MIGTFKLRLDPNAETSQFIRHVATSTACISAHLIRSLRNKHNNIMYITVNLRGDAVPERTIAEGNVYVIQYA